MPDTRDRTRASAIPLPTLELIRRAMRGVEKPCASPNETASLRRLRSRARAAASAASRRFRFLAACSSRSSELRSVGEGMQVLLLGQSRVLLDLPTLFGFSFEAFERRFDVFDPKDARDLFDRG